MTEFFHYDVGEFHEKFGLRNTNDEMSYGPRPDYATKELMEFRLKFLEEELEEFRKALEAGDDAEMADALVDLIYVASGTAHLKGYPMVELWDDVQRANMEKQRALEDGSNSKRGSSFDVVKPEGWRPPMTREIMRKWGFDV